MRSSPTGCRCTACRIRYRAAARADHHHHYDAATFLRAAATLRRDGRVLYELQPALKKWLDIRRLERRRMEILAAGGPSPAVARVAASLDRLEHRALALAAWAERTGGVALDPLLHPLFEVGYLGGLADALFTVEGARTVRAAEFLRLVPPGARLLARQAGHDGVPLPSVDVADLASLDDPF